jgi:NADPH:quinone reductase-like Zn-dependent oxidoreductase
MALLARCVGGYSSRVVVPESALARIPDTLSFEEAAALPLVALTAWQVGLISAVECCAAYLLLPVACGSTFSLLCRVQQAVWSRSVCCFCCCHPPAAQGLDLAHVQAGDHVLIHAGAGGVGSVAIQLAKARGLQVVTTCSGRNADFVREVRLPSQALLKQAG